MALPLIIAGVAARAGAKKLAKNLAKNLAKKAEKKKGVLKAKNASTQKKLGKPSNPTKAAVKRESKTLGTTGPAVARRAQDKGKMFDPNMTGWGRFSK
tara:strand:- start:2942 stop:3235 length:294 start_codon:yes stop_codon:yes gene_type:complete